MINVQTKPLRQPPVSFIQIETYLLLYRGEASALSFYIENYNDAAATANKKKSQNWRKSIADDDAYTSIYIKHFLEMWTR